MTVQSQLNPDLSNAVSAAPDATISPAAKFRWKELLKLYQHRHGNRLPADDNGRRAAARICEAFAVSGDQGRKRANEFLSEWCPWMLFSEKSKLISLAFKSPWLWPASALGEDLALTWAEREACKIGTFRPAGATVADLDERLKAKAKARRREKKREADLKQKPKIPLADIRAQAILEILRPGERVAVSALCSHLKRTKPIHFATFVGDQAKLRAAVHEAIAAGVRRGILQKQLEPGLRGLPVAWIART